MFKCLFGGQPKQNLFDIFNNHKGGVMKKLFFSIFVLFMAVTLTQAQTDKGKFAVGVGGEVALASGDAADAADLGTGFGGSARVEYGFSDKLVGFADVGYLMWPGGDVTSGAYKISWDWSAITVLAGAKYFFNKGFYAMAQIGIHSFTFDSEVSGPSSGYFTPSSGSSSDSKFGFGAGLGYELPISKTMLLDLNAKYMLAASDFNYIGVRAGLKFPLK